MHSIKLFQEFIFLHPFSFLSLIFLLIFIYRWTSPNPTTKKQKTPPSPPRLPIIGNLHQLGTYPYRTLQTLTQKYGDLIFLKLGSKPAIIVLSAESASQILKTHDLIFANRPNLSVFRRLLANGKDILSSSYGEHWRQLKSICVMQLLSTKRVLSFRSVREEELELMMNKIKGMPMVNLSEMFLSLSTDVICRIAFGKKYRGDSGIELHKLLKELSRLLGGYYVGDFIPWLSWIDSFNGVDAEVSRFLSGFDKFFNRVIEEHIVCRGDGEGNELEKRDFVDVLLDAQKDDGSGDFSLEKESIKALILDIFTAGTVTTAVSLEWMMSELIRNPRIMKNHNKFVESPTGKLAHLHAIYTHFPTHNNQNPPKKTQNTTPKPTTKPSKASNHRKPPSTRKVPTSLPSPNNRKTRSNRLGEVPTVFVSSSETAKEFMKTQDLAFCSRPQLFSATWLFYNCTNIVFSPYGAYWRHVRKICILELLSTKRVQSYEFVRGEEVARLCSRVKKASESGSGVVNVTKLLGLYANDVLCRVVLGRSFSQGGEYDKHGFQSMLDEYQELLGGFSIGDFFPSKEFLHTLTGHKRRLVKTFRRFDRFFDEVIQEHLDMNREEKGNKDLLDVLLDVQRDEKGEMPLTMDNVKAILLKLLVYPCTRFPSSSLLLNHALYD
ncbi:hypothetical protein V2J09_011920 [Rumex salicifolius]